MSVNDKKAGSHFLRAGQRKFIFIVREIYRRRPVFAGTSGWFIAKA